MISSLSEIEELAKAADPVTTAIIAPEDHEFMLAVKDARQRSFIEPVLIGRRTVIEKAADKANYDLDTTRIIEVTDRQKIANTAMEMLSSGEVEMVSKGQISTSYVYRAIIARMKARQEEAVISVQTFWDIKGCDHLVLLTDTGTNISPDENEKRAILNNALQVMPLLGYTCPKVMELVSDSANLKDKYKHFKLAKTPVIKDSKGTYQRLEAQVLKKVLLGEDSNSVNLNSLPHIMLMPDLNTGNMIAKLDFFIKDIVRVSCCYTSMGPVIVPSRSDLAEAIMREIIFGVALVAQRRRLNND
ncbi:MAG: phosphate butyryltransferase [Deltaproteobacteria bacterium]|nr:phosphate butyryltransferase [Candidatus Tharpella aukensis]